MDARFARLVRTLREKQDRAGFTEDDIESLLQNIMFQKARALSARRRAAVMHDRVRQLELTVRVHNDSSLDQETKDSFLGLAAEEKADPRHSQRMQMQIALENVHYVFDLQRPRLEDKARTDLAVSRVRVRDLRKRLGA